VAGSTKSKTQQSDKAAFKDSKNAGLTKDNRTVEDGADTDEAVEEKVSKTKEAPKTEIMNQMAEEPADEMTIDEIISALEQIMEQIKEILGITDEELLSGMEELGIQPVDLLNTDNMAQLVTTIAGEDSTISLVANEELYTAVQDLTETVGTQVNTLLENTGLTSEELDAILQKLQELEGKNLEDQLQDAEILPMEGQDESAVPEEELAQTFDGPIIIKEDNTQSSDRAAKQYDKLPENQQENPAQIGTKPQTQNTEKDTKGSDDKESKHFGQNGTAQDFQNNLNEVSDMTAAEGVGKYTSDSTESIMRQLADMVKIVRNENLTEMELQLHPASLGTVNVSLTTKGGMVTAEFTTQNEA
ncbi:MAG: flagellar hook-length control protein FliK, partial [Lachnospiraceae bacterium]|nr:flagellar hook-length control protein FliK [Lachnospiraceae bacterium]